MSESYVGEIRCFGFSFAPRQWALCNGQIMSIAQNTALFSILGTTYGGNGQSTFGLPNLQGRSPMHWGAGPGLNTTIGEVMGQTTVTLSSNEIPQHNHTITVGEPAQGQGSERTAGPSSTSFLSEGKGGLVYQNSPSTPNTAFASAAISQTGGSLPHENQ